LTSYVTVAINSKRFDETTHVIACLNGQIVEIFVPWVALQMRPDEFSDRYLALMVERLLWKIVFKDKPEQLLVGDEYEVATEGQLWN
jgi:hypothetical protein